MPFETLTFDVGPSSRSLQFVLMRKTFEPSYMVMHQCISKLWTKHEMLQTDGQDAFLQFPPNYVAGY